MLAYLGFICFPSTPIWTLSKGTVLDTVFPVDPVVHLVAHFDNLFPSFFTGQTRTIIASHSFVEHVLSLIGTVCHNYGLHTNNDHKKQRNIGRTVRFGCVQLDLMMSTTGVDTAFALAAIAGRTPLVAFEFDRLTYPSLANSGDPMYAWRQGRLKPIRTRPVSAQKVSFNLFHHWSLKFY